MTSSGALKIGYPAKGRSGLIVPSKSPNAKSAEETNGVICS